MSIQQHEIEDYYQVLNRLGRAIGDHNAWFMLWHRTLICKLPVGSDYLAQDGHQRCKFGQWQARGVPRFLAESPDFDQIDQAHRAMHDTARELALKTHHGQAITPLEYDALLGHRNRFRDLLGTLEKSLHKLISHTDPLTRVLNRQGMIQALEEEQERLKSTGDRSTLCLLDLDHFKSINDRYGHLAGDHVLQKTAAFVTTHLRPGDLIFRYGGEEFLICLPATELATAVIILNRVRVALAAEPFDALTPGLTQVTGSFGAAEFDPTQPVTHSIERADRAVYRAKSEGRNRVCLFSDAANAGPGRPPHEQESDDSSDGHPFSRVNACP
ncbi:MAG: diguanylate cyclase [Magnetococcales bacterium]|nr:diguanylate cyclase [Magnetococcales bacterium]